MSVARVFLVLAAALVLRPLPALAGGPPPAPPPSATSVRISLGEVMRCGCRVAATRLSVAAAAVQLRVPGLAHRVPVPARLAVQLRVAGGLALSARLGAGGLLPPLEVELGPPG